MRFDLAYQCQDGKMVVPGEAFDNECVGVCSQNDEDDGHHGHGPGDAHHQWTSAAIGTF